jgi:hypothetical protein
VDAVEDGKGVPTPGRGRLMEGRDKCVSRLYKLISALISRSSRSARARSPTAICHRGDGQSDVQRPAASDCSRPLGRECVAAPQSINLPFHVRAGNLANHLGSAISRCSLKRSIEGDGNFESRRIGWVWGEVWVGKNIGERVMLDG